MSPAVVSLQLNSAMRDSDSITCKVKGPRRCTQRWYWLWSCLIVFALITDSDDAVRSRVTTRAMPPNRIRQGVGVNTRISPPKQRALALNEIVMGSSAQRALRNRTSLEFA
jgi:hypothetical protein